jgi:hypothetical protein
VTDASLLTLSGVGFLYTTAAASGTTSRRVVFDAAWASRTRSYDEAVDGAYNATSGLPFYGPSAQDSVVWDTDYAPVGDGLPDYWGSFVYDTAWAFGYAISSSPEASR